MDFFASVDPATLRDRTPIAESDQFALYALEGDTYLIVQRHDGTTWAGVRVSGDGVFRVGALLVEAMRHLYRDVASNLSPINLRK